MNFQAILSNQHEIDQWLDFGRYNTEEVEIDIFLIRKDEVYSQVLPLLVSHNDIHMYRVTPNVGSTKTNDMNNIRPINTDKEK